MDRNPSTQERNRFLVEIEELKETVAAFRARLEEADLSINTYSQAVKRGEEMFLEAHPEYRERLALPGTDRLVCWLLEQLAAYESRDETWRGKKEMLENDLAKAWERLEEVESQLARYREGFKKVKEFISECQADVETVESKGVSES